MQETTIEDAGRGAVFACVTHFNAFLANFRHLFETLSACVKIVKKLYKTTVDDYQMNNSICIDEFIFSGHLHLHMRQQQQQQAHR